MVVINGKTVVVLSVNCQGLQTLSKRLDVMSYLKEKNPDIVCLQDTHWITEDLAEIKKIWDGECIIHGIKTNSRGVAILFGKNFEYSIGEIERDELGNMIAMDIKIDCIQVKLINVYGPNKDTPSFYKRISDIITTNENTYVLICGDLNIALDPQKDTYNYLNSNNPNSRKIILDLISEFDLIDIFRNLHPDANRYTWRRRNPVKQARLDYFLASNTLLDLVHQCEILPGYRTDHSVIKLEIFITKFKHGKGLWKFNTSLLNNQEYLSLINDAIVDEMLQYALPVYNPVYVKQNNLENTQLRIGETLFLETLLMRLRGESIKFATQLKKIIMKKRKS